jgi:lathosterol oxidase
MDELLELTNIYLVDPLLGDVASTKHASYAPWSEDYSHKRQFLVLWAFLYLSSMLVYVIFGMGTFVAFFVNQRKENREATRKEHHSIGGKQSVHTDNPAYWPWDNAQLRNEVWVSTWSLFIMAGLTACVDMYFLLGGSKLYHNIDDYGLVYFVLSPLFFLLFTDALIYWIHRILHWPSVYWLHKLHHKYKETTPWSAFSFHPLDGFAQSVPYHLFALFFPMHSRLYTLTLMCVGLWTVNIHDRMTLRLWGVNGAAHHTIHHTKFNCNYGQYFTFSDQLFGTFKDPYQQWPYELDENVIERVKQQEAKELAQARRVSPVFNPDPDLAHNQPNGGKKGQ